MNNCQKLQLERIKQGSFNDFDGDVVAADLAKHEKLWKAFVFGRFKYSQLIELRDLADDHINADTIYILCKEENVPVLEELARKWCANEIGYYTTQDDKVACSGTVDFRTDELLQVYGCRLENGYALIRLWWD